MRLHNRRIKTTPACYLKGFRCAVETRACQWRRMTGGVDPIHHFMIFCILYHSKSVVISRISVGFTLGSSVALVGCVGCVGCVADSALITDSADGSTRSPRI